MKSAAPFASVIVTTYNQPRYLEMVLIALSQQTQNGFEVIIGDDGSTTETADLIDRYRRSSHVPFTLKHFWQPDQGFRVGEARNGAIRISEGDWLIFIDGDMVVHPRFVEAHMKMSAPDRVLFGGRVKLNENFSKSLQPENLFRESIVTIFNRNRTTGRENRYSPVTESLADILGGWFVQNFAGEDHPFWETALNSLSAVTTRRIFQKLCFKSGSNFSTSRILMERVNGFDHAFHGLSGEDGELFWRLLHAGAKPQSVLLTAIAYHLWHSDNWQRQGEQRQMALERERQTRNLRKIYCEKGLICEQP